MKKILSHKNFTGSIEYSSEDKIYFGKITNTNDLVSYEANSIKELEIEFKQAVKDYIETKEYLN